MPELYLTSDTHLSHARVLEFKNKDGTPLRPFSCVEEMDETIIANWNKTVPVTAKVYHLGDVVFGGNYQILSRLNGNKRLIAGNHDDVNKLVPYFKKIGVMRIFKEHDMILTHIPVHRACFRGRVRFNVHGHTHDLRLPEPCYVNICTEHTDFCPLHIEEVVARCKAKEHLLTEYTGEMH